MADNYIELFVLTFDEWVSWKNSCQKYDKSDNHDVVTISIDRKQLENIPAIQGKLFRADLDIRVIDVINGVRNAIPNFQDDVWIPNSEMKEMFPNFDFKTSYFFYCPAISDEKIDTSYKLSDLGIREFEVVVIKQYKHQPPQPHAHDIVTAKLRSVINFSDFQKLILSNGEPKDKERLFGEALYATLLYTDDDIFLAKYIREHFDELNAMSGTEINIFIVEAPPQNSMGAAAEYWKSNIARNIYTSWALLGWVKSKPYDKTAVYEIAKSLHVYPDELPCLVVFDRTDRKNKLIFPVKDELPIYFRKTISAIQRSLKATNFNDDFDVFLKSFDTRQDKFDKLCNSLQQCYIDKSPGRTIYNFYGQTVFINHPSGTIQFQDFNNIKGYTEENKS